MNWICTACAAALGSSIPAGHVATFHLGTCDVCGSEKEVTQPSDFRPRPDAHRPTTTATPPT